MRRDLLTRVIRMRLLLLLALCGLLASCAGGARGPDSGLPSSPPTEHPPTPAELPHSSPPLDSELSLGDMLSQLEALVKPDTVEHSAWEALRGSLRLQLLDSGRAKWTSAAPLDSANAVDDLYLTRIDDTNALAHWNYRNVGDYDQNSQANISDLSALGANLGKSPASADWASASVCDGDGNGEVNISDLTPLGAHLLNTVDAYSLQTSFTPQIELSWIEVAQVPLDSASPAGSGLRHFSFGVEAAPGQSFRVVPLSGQQRGVVSSAYLYDGQGGAPPMDPELRQQVLDAIELKLSSLSATTSEEQDAEIADFLASQPALTASGHADGVIWATFEDGRGVTIFKNMGTVDEESESLAHGVSSAGTLSAMARQTSISLPWDKKAVLLNAFGAAEKPSFQQMTKAARDALEADGTYDMEEQPLSVDNFRALREAGLLFAAAHGGIRRNAAGQEYYVLVSSTKQTSALDTAYANDFAWGALEYAFAPLTNGSYEKRYAFTAAFLMEMQLLAETYNNEISFAEDALVFLPGCSGGHDGAADFRGALFTCGASVVIGWDRVVYTDQAADAAGQFFDGVLGTSTAPGSLQDPPQRPFSYGDIIGDMASRGICATPGVPVVYPPGRMSYLRIHFSPTSLFDDGAGQLLPTITRMEVDEGNHQMLLYGDFGFFEPEVLISGQPVDVNTYLMPFNLFVDLDFSTGEQSMGYVQASVDGRLSNPRKLSSWKGNVILTQIGPGSLTRQISFFVHFRADLDNWRNQPGDLEELGGAAHDGMVSFVCAPDSNAFVTASGSDVDNDDIRTTWDNGELRILDMYYAQGGGPGPASAMYASGHFNMAQNKVFLHAEGVGLNHVLVENTGDDSVISDGEQPFDDRIDMHWFPGVEMSIDPLTWDIAEGQMPPVVEGDITYTVTWEAIPCETGGPLLPAFSR